MRSQPTRYLGALSVALVLATGISACRSESGPTIDEARRFVEDAEARLLRLWIDAGRAAWIQNNFITDDTNAIAAEANTAVMAATTELAAGAARFNQLDLPADLARKLTLLKTSLAAVAPSDPAVAAGALRDRHRDGKHVRTRQVLPGSSRGVSRFADDGADLRRRA